MKKEASRLVERGGYPSCPHASALGVRTKPPTGVTVVSDLVRGYISTQDGRSRVSCLNPSPPSLADELSSGEPMIQARLFRALRAGAVSLLAGMSAILVAPSASVAEQFVLFDATFTYTKTDADNSKPSKSHYYVREPTLSPDRPRDWTAPVDYRNGTVHIRAEVIEKPEGREPTTWTLCYIPNKGQGPGYGCTGTVLYRDKGVYERDISMKSFWQNDAIVWSEGIKRMDLVIKDDSGGNGHAHKRKDSEKFFPTKMRITMIQVSAGSTYDPSLVPNLPPITGLDGGKPKGASAPTVPAPGSASNGTTGRGVETTKAPVESCCEAELP
jgi:hypothetical protein